MGSIKTKEVTVYFNGTRVGKLALIPNGLVAFSYAPNWLLSGFSLSPYALPLTPGVFIPKKDSFGGLFGVFADSLPDSWGSFVTSTYLTSKGIDPSALNPLERLCLLNSKSLGALTYGSPEKKPLKEQAISLGSLQKDIDDLIVRRDDASLEEIMTLGGSSGGANPKVHLKKDGKEWIVKFPQGPLSPYLAQMEYDYNVAAKACGIPVPEFALWSGENGRSYFASVRFDREGERRIHRLSLAALYDAPLEKGALDYGYLFQSVKDFSHDSTALYDVFRRLYFNVVAGNEDDHGKNFAFLYDEISRHYVLSPAYDLTLSLPKKPHGLSVARNFNPTKADVEKLADHFSLERSHYEKIEHEVDAVVQSHLASYLAKRR